MYEKSCLVNSITIPIFQNTLAASLGGSSRKSSVTSSNFDTTDVLTPAKNQPKQIYEEYFPELFTY